VQKEHDDYFVLIRVCVSLTDTIVRSISLPLFLLTLQDMEANQLLSKSSSLDSLDKLLNLVESLSVSSRLKVALA
jgi:hypothetical protein